MPPADPKVTTPVQVTPENFHSVATQIGNAVAQLTDAAGRLHATTSSAAGIGGVDDGAKQFDTGYQEALNTLFETFDRAGDVLTDMSLGIDLSGYNHWHADAAATPGGPATPPWNLVSGLYLPQGLRATSLVGNPVMALPAPLNAKIPLGHQTLLHELADGFTETANRVNDLRNGVFNELLELFANNSSADLDALNSYWNTIGGSSDTGILTALENGCQQLAQAVSGFAGWIGDTQNEIVDQIISFTGEVAKNTALSLIPALLASLFTEGIGGLPELVQVLQKVGEFGELVGVVEAIDVVAAGRLASGILVIATNANTAMTAAMSSTPNPNLDPASPQSTPNTPSDDQVVQSAENIGDQADKIDGLTPEQYQQAVSDLIDDSNQKFKLEPVNAQTILSSGPPGSIPEVAGPGGSGADVVFRDESNQVVDVTEVKCLSGESPNSFSSELSDVKAQLKGTPGWEKSEGNVVFQVNVDSAKVRQWMEAFQGRRSDVNLGKYSGINVTFVDANGNMLGSFDPSVRMQG